MAVDQTFHTPSFGDEEFEIPSLNLQHSSVVIQHHSYDNQMSAMLTRNQINGRMLLNNHHHQQQQQHQHHQQQAYPQQQQQQQQGMYQGMQDGSAQNMSMGIHPYESSNYGLIQETSPQLHQMALMQPPLHRQLVPLQMGRGGSPPGSTHTSPGQETSEDSDDSTPLSQLMSGVLKRPSPEPSDYVQQQTQHQQQHQQQQHQQQQQQQQQQHQHPHMNQMNGRIMPSALKKPKPPKKKKKRDPNEPQKPVSAYALFFRDTQAAIKGQNPNASFGEVSKIVASMWDSLDADHKNVYKKKTEAAKKEYLKALAAYRASLVSKAAADQSDNLYGGVGSMSSPHMLGSSPSPPSQSLSPLQKKSPLLTSLMEGSSSSPPMQQALSPPIQQQQQQALSPTAMCNNSGWPPQHNMNQGMMMHHSPPHMAQSPPHQQPAQQQHHHQHHQQHQQQQQMHMMLGMGGNPGGGSSQMTHMPQNQQQTGSSPSHSGQQQQQQQQQQNMNQEAESPGFSSMAPSPPVGLGGGGGNAQHPNGGLSSNPLTGSSMVQTCLRSGCMNPAIDSPDWDREYCSSECVVSHCRDVFSSWVSTRQTTNSNYASVK